jgi:heat shock protein 4
LNLVGGYGGFTSETKNKLMEEEGKMASSDKLVMETEERKNALEEYVYDTRGKLDGRYASFVQPKEKEELLAGLQAAEDWLYTDEGEDASKSAYVEKTGDPVYNRWKESEERPKAAAALREVVNNWLSIAQSGDEKYSHITDADKEKVVSIRSHDI